MQPPGGSPGMAAFGSGGFGAPGAYGSMNGPSSGAFPSPYPSPAGGHPGGFGPPPGVMPGMSPGMMPPGGPPLGSTPQKSHLRSGSRADQMPDYAGAPVKPKSRLNMWELILIPWLVMLAVLSCFVFAGEENSSVLWLVPTVLLVFDSAFTYYRFKAGHSAEMVLGLLCLLGIVAAVVVGLFVDVSALNEYWRLGRGASYANVLPENSAQSRNDATSLVFSGDSAVDQDRTYGFVDGRSQSGTIYCVAPVVDSSGSTRVNYWAAGVNCCFPRTGFTCGGSSDSNAHGAVVMSSKMQTNPFFAKAIQGAESVYGLQAADAYMLVDWMADPVAYRERLWLKAQTVAGVFAFVYLIVSGLLGAAIFPSIKQ